MYRLASWQEPNAPSDQGHVTVPALGIQASLNLARSLNAGTQATAWLTGDEPLSLNIELGLASEEHDPQTAYAALLLDGVVQPLQVDGTSQDTVDAPLHPGDIVRQAMTVAPGAISRGAHSATLLVWAAKGSALAEWSFTVLANSVHFVDRPRPVDAKITHVPEQSASEVWRSGSTWSLNTLTGSMDHPDADGTLPLSFLITPSWSGECTQLVHRQVLVAFLDNHQVELGDFGLRPAFELTQGQAATLDLVLKGLPTDTGHTLQFWLLGGDGAYAEAPMGETSLWWDFPVQLGRLVW